MNTLFLTKKNFDEAVAKTADVLKRNGLVVAPSDTVYALIVNAASANSVKKLIEFKSRPAGKPISVFVTGFKELEDNAGLNGYQSKIVRELLPGPFTVILPSRHKVAPMLESEKGTLGLRIPDYPFINRLVREFGKPLTATSANVSGRSPHYRISTLLNELPKAKKGLVDLIVDAGQLPHNEPSTVVDLTGSDLKIVRQGDITFKSSKNFLSKSASQTQKIGRYIFEKYRELSSTKPLIFIIEGELGVGKTVLIKGMGEAMGIDNIISPSYVIYYEYGNFYHFDLYNVQEHEEFGHLGIDKLLKPGNILAFEWGEKSGDIIDKLKKKGNVVYIRMRYVSEKEREVIIKS